MLAMKRAIIIDSKKSEKFKSDMKKNAANSEFWKQSKQATNSINIAKLDELFKK